MMAQVPGFLPPVCEIWITFLDCGFGLGPALVTGEHLGSEPAHDMLSVSPLNQPFFKTLVSNGKVCAFISLFDTSISTVSLEQLNLVFFHFVA